jgi:ATP adenylyltransferase
VSLQRLWAGWRMPYVSGAAAWGGDKGTDDKPTDDQRSQAGAGARREDCVFCRILSGAEPDEVTYVVWRGRRCLAVLNTFPYASGHLMVMPTRHVADLEEIAGEEATDLWAALSDAVRALKASYHPDGVNVGVNLGRAAGAGIPGHFHIHVVPRWVGDTNFTTAVAEARVLPESLPDSWSRLRAAWPAGNQAQA